MSLQEQNIFLLKKEKQCFAASQLTNNFRHA